MTSWTRSELPGFSPSAGYPEGYEVATTTKGGLKILIRPIRADDGPLLKTLFEKLSPKTIYYRFFMPLKSLSEDMIEKLTRIDHTKDVVLVAVDRSGQEEGILGVFRLMCPSDRETGELAILVGDPWQGKGVGAKLFKHGIFIARERGIRSAYGMVMGENKTVLALARKMGFSTKWDVDAHAYQLEMDLTSIDEDSLLDSRMESRPKES